MFKKSLLILVGLNFVIILTFTFSYSKHASSVPLYVGLLPLILLNYIYTREFISPKPVVTQSALDESKKKPNTWGLLIMPVMFCLYLPKLIQFDNSLGWSPAISVGFSVLLCLVLISLYGGLKTALRVKK